MKSYWCRALKLPYFRDFVELAHFWLPLGWKCGEAGLVASAAPPTPSHSVLGVKNHLVLSRTEGLFQTLISFSRRDAGGLVFTHARAKKITL